jgi:hypothetical protein
MNGRHWNADGTSIYEWATLTHTKIMNFNLKSFFYMYFMDTNIIVVCPHCKEPILIEKLNCCIFRHGMLKHNKTQIHPHASKVLCDFYITNKLIYGCGKPFQVVQNMKPTNDEDKFEAVICDYI